MPERVQFDRSTALGRHADAERRLREHQASVRQAGLPIDCNSTICTAINQRNIAYQAYTGTPHPSTLRGGSVVAA